MPATTLSGIPIGQEGGSISFRLNPRTQQIQPEDIRRLGNQELRRRFSILREIESQGRLTPNQQDDLLKLQQELKGRETSEGSAEEAVLRGIVESANVGAPGITAQAPAMPSESTLESEIKRATEARRSALIDAIAAAQGAGIRDIEEDVAARRAKLIGEQAVTGRFGSPIAQRPIGRLEAERARSISDLIQKLRGQEVEAKAGIESEGISALQREREMARELGLRERLGLGELGLRERLGLGQERLGIGQLISGERQFGRKFGLEEQRLAEEARAAALGNLAQREENELAAQLGRAQARAQEPNIISQISGILGGVGELAGGVGTFRGAGGASGGLKTTTKGIGKVGLGAGVDLGRGFLREQTVEPNLRRRFPNV